MPSMKRKCCCGPDTCHACSHGDGIAPCPEVYGGTGYGGKRSRPRWYKVVLSGLTRCDDCYEQAAVPITGGPGGTIDLCCEHDTPVHMDGTYYLPFVSCVRTENDGLIRDVSTWQLALDDETYEWTAYEGTCAAKGGWNGHFIATRAVLTLTVTQEHYGPDEGCEEDTWYWYVDFTLSYVGTEYVSQFGDYVAGSQGAFWWSSWDRQEETYVEQSCTACGGDSEVDALGCTFAYGCALCGTPPAWHCHVTTWPFHGGAFVATPEYTAEHS